jgi:ADP-heptose:LPS heptosyltransferase
MTRKILVILPNNLGDVIMAVPVLEGLKRLAPGSHITFFVEDGYEGGLVNNPFCDAVYRFKRGTVRDLSRGKDWPEALTLIRETVAELKSERFDRIINLSQHSYIPYIVSLLACPDTVGREYLRAGNQALRDTWSQYLYAIPFARFFNGLHATDIYRGIAGTGAVIPAAAMSVTEEEQRDALGKITSLGWNPHEKPVMVFQPGAAFAAKRWPLEHFTALGKRLIDDGFAILVTGAPQELEIARGLVSQLGSGGFSTAGILSFRETIALLPSTEGCVTGDTAIMHAASALKKKVYALFGPTSPVETGPYGECNIVLCGRCARRPCFCFDCKTRLCMKSILPEDVYACIKAGGAVRQAACDVYSTALRAGGTFLLDAVVEAGPPFFHRPGAEATRRFAEPDFMPLTPIQPHDKEYLSRETDVFLGILVEMAGALASFLTTRDTSHVRFSEERRAKLGGLSGIGAFWTAVLNLRLNSVPMLDPVAAVRLCLDQCVRTKSEIEHALSIFR